MNHYINLLEDSERRYFSAAESSPLLKVGAVSAVVLILAALGLWMAQSGKTIQQGRQLSQRWREIEKPVAEAQSRADLLRRLDREHATLRGWDSSRFEWFTILEFIQDRLPAPESQFSFRNLSFDEEIAGLKRHRPDNETLVDPLVRQIRIDLRGYIAGTRPELALAEFERQLLDSTSPFDWARLVNNDPQPGISSPERPVSQFLFFLNLRSREMKP